jgi:mannose-6-phosphate isomerase-like protein (cupin superfamily)
MVRKKVVFRPWGFFEEFCENTECSVKLHHINAGQEFSLQKHKKRKEFWKIVSGKGIVVVGAKEHKFSPGKEFFIKKNALHKLKADSKTLLLEICYGFFDENDEIRIKDKYGRKSPKKSK